MTTVFDATLRSRGSKMIAKRV